MRNTTGRLQAPVEKTASGVLDYIAEAGGKLLSHQGLLASKLPLDSFALSAGLGAGTQQVANRLLRNRMYNSPNLRKAIELGTATAVGGGAGLAGALAAPLSTQVSRGTGANAARRLAELTAMGTGAEYLASPFVSQLTGVAMSPGQVLARMAGGGGLAAAGATASELRKLDIIRRAHASGIRLPKAVVNEYTMTAGPRAAAAQVYRNMGMPRGLEAGILGAGLFAAGNPFLGGAAMLSAPLINPESSKFLGEIAEGLTKKKKTTKAIDELYKKSSVNYGVKLAAPVYMTRPAYALDAMTMDKFANWFSKGLSKLKPVGNAVMAGVRGVGEKGVAGATRFNASRLNPKNFIAPSAEYAERQGARAAQRAAKGQGVQLNVPQVAESAAATGPASTARNPLNETTGNWWERASNKAKNRRRANNPSLYAQTEEGAAAYQELGGARGRYDSYAANRRLTESNISQQAQTNAPVGSPLNAPVRSGTAPDALGQARAPQFPTPPRPQFTPRNVGTNRELGLEVANLRGAGYEGNSALQLLEGPSPVRGGVTATVTRGAETAQKQAAGKAGLNAAAEANQVATARLASYVDTTTAGAFRNGRIRAAFKTSLDRLGKSQGEVNPQAIIADIRSQLPNISDSAAAKIEAEISSVMASPSGQAFREAQANLDTAFGRYQEALETNLAQEADRAIARRSKELAKKVKNQTGRREGLPGINRREVMGAEDIASMNNVQALAETRVRIMTGKGATAAEKAQAAELLRITESVVEHGSPAQIAALEKELASSVANVESFGAQHPLLPFLDTEARKGVFTLKGDQVKELEKVVTRKGRGVGDIDAEVSKVFTEQALASPNSTAGREVATYLNGAGTEGARLLEVAETKGPGRSATTKLLSSEPGASDIGNFSAREIEVLSAQPVTHTVSSSLPQGAQTEFNDLFLNGKTFTENMSNLDAQIKRQEVIVFRGRGPNTAPAQQRLDLLRGLKAEASTFRQSQEQALAPYRRAANTARTNAQNAIKSEVAIGDVRLNSDIANIRKPKELNIESLRAQAEAPMVDELGNIVVTEGRTKAVAGIFENIKRTNPSISDEAIAEYMVREGLVNVQELAMMGGSRALPQELAAMSGAGFKAQMATGLGIAGIGGAAAYAGNRNRGGAATRARNKTMQPQGSWGLSALHAPVAYQKKTAMSAPTVPKGAQPPLPKFKANNVPKPMNTGVIQSPMTAQVNTPGSMLAAPVMGEY